MQDLIDQTRDLRGRVVKLDERAHKLSAVKVADKGAAKKLPTLGLENWDSSILGRGELRKLFDDHIEGGFFYLPNEKRKNKIGDHIPWADELAELYVIKENKGKKYRFYTGPNAGIYHMGRGTSKISYTTLNLFRATKDLTILDVACAEVDSLMRTAKDESGINSTEPDGFDGFAYGVNGHRQIFFGPNDPRNTAVVVDGEIEYANSVKRGNGDMKRMTGIELQLEEGLWVSAMAVAKEAYENRNKYSPTYEKKDDRPSSPQYYRSVYKRALKIYEDTCKKWDKYFRDRVESELPMSIDRSLIHSLLNEMTSRIGHAKIVGGADWMKHDSYKQVARAWKMVFGDSERVGAQKNVQLAMWTVAKHPKWGPCLLYAHRAKRFEPDGKQKRDSTGEYPTRNLGKQYVHPNDYVSDDFGAMSWMYEEGCDFITEDWLKMVGNTVLATMTNGDLYERNGKPTPVPYGMHGNELVPELSSPWGQGKSLHGSSSGLLTGSTLAGLSAYTDHYEEFQALIKGSMKRWVESSDQTYGGWTGLLMGAARQEGRI